MKKKASMPDERTIPRWAQILIALVWLAVIVFCFLHRDRLTVESIAGMGSGSVILTVLMMLGLFALKSLSVVMYCGVLYAASGVLFPLPFAILLNLCGTTVMATIPYRLGRRMGVAAVDRIAAKYPNAEILKRLPSENVFLFTVILRAIGLLPLDIVSAYMGAAKTRYAPYLLGTLAGMASSCILFPILGMSITDRNSKQFPVAAALQLLVMAVSALGVYFLRKKDKEVK